MWVGGLVDFNPFCGFSHIFYCLLIWILCKYETHLEKKWSRSRWEAFNLNFLFISDTQTPAPSSLDEPHCCSPSLACSFRRRVSRVPLRCPVPRFVCPGQPTDCHRSRFRWWMDGLMDGWLHRKRLTLHSHLCQTSPGENNCIISFVALLMFSCRFCVAPKQRNKPGSELQIESLALINSPFSYSQIDYGHFVAQVKVSKNPLWFTLSDHIPTEAPRGKTAWSSF